MSADARAGDKDDGGGRTRRGFGRRRALLALLALLLVAWIALELPDFAARAELGSAYAARAGCACHFVEGRPFESCHGDLEAAAWMISMELDPSARSVTGSTPLLASRTARYREGWGCLLDPLD